MDGREERILMALRFVGEDLFFPPLLGVVAVPLSNVLL
jgi:hypothetical protein